MSFRRNCVIILRHIKNIPYYFAIWIILYVSYESLFLVIPKLSLHPLLYIILYCAALFGIFKTLHYIILLGKLKLHTTDLLIELGGIPINGSSYRCKKCQRYIPIDAYHCSVCDICVQEHDHHCIFLNRCIGKGNIRVFRKLIIAILLCTLLLNTCLVRLRYLKIHHDQYSNAIYIRLATINLLSPILSVMMVILLAAQYEENTNYFYNVFKNIGNKL